MIVLLIQPSLLSHSSLSRLLEKQNFFHFFYFFFFFVCLSVSLSLFLLFCSHSNLFHYSFITCRWNTVIHSHPPQGLKHKGTQPTNNNQKQRGRPTMATFRFFNIY